MEWLKDLLRIYSKQAILLHKPRKLWLQIYCLYCQTWITEATALAQAHRIWFKFHSFSKLFEVRKLADLQFVAV